MFVYLLLQNMAASDTVIKVLEKIKTIVPDEDYKIATEDKDKYAEFEELVKRVTDENNRIEALKAEIESATSEEIEKKLVKICDPDKIRTIKDALRVQTFQMSIDEPDGERDYFVTATRRGKEVFPPLELKSTNDINRSVKQQYSSILIEVVILLVKSAGVKTECSERAIVNTAQETIGLLDESVVMMEALKEFVEAWGKSSLKWSQADAIFNLVKAADDDGILWKTLKLLYAEMTDWDYFKTVTVVATALNAGAPLIAKFVLALESASVLSKKVANVCDLFSIQSKMDAKWNC